MRTLILTFIWTMTMTMMMIMKKKSTRRSPFNPAPPQLHIHQGPHIILVKHMKWPICPKNRAAEVKQFLKLLK